MTTFVALLRAVNVSGQNKIPMAELRGALGGLGLTGVETYLQSGNVVFDAEGDDPTEQAAATHGLIERDFGRERAGRLLATGRFRDDGQGAMGPSLFAIAPWLAGDPPVPGARLDAITLLRCDSVYGGGEHVLTGYHHSDEWSGVAWLTAGEASAVVFAGTEGLGDCCYGFADGTVWPDEPTYPPVPPDGEHGWWSSAFAGELLFYDPAELAVVAVGSAAPHSSQPYATLEPAATSSRAQRQSRRARRRRSWSTAPRSV